MILDLNLPGDTGWDLLRGSSLAAAGSPPVIIASATTVSPRRLAEFDVAGYLPKPFPLETLRRDPRATARHPEGGFHPMTDVLVILLILGWGLGFLAFVEFCELVRR